MDKKTIKRTINQLGRVRKSIVISQSEKQQLEKIRRRLYKELENTKE